mmetsp:Transcript_38797/g.63450  ORF Transcript_38797/g.63450 Transcript_38797/m.63450 type:complete len:167 (+) Transcript_38797:317-817(+)
MMMATDPTQQNANTPRILTGNFFLWSMASREGYQYSNMHNTTTRRPRRLQRSAHFSALVIESMPSLPLTHYWRCCPITSLDNSSCHLCHQQPWPIRKYNNKQLPLKNGWNNGKQCWKTNDTLHSYFWGVIFGLSCASWLLSQHKQSYSISSSYELEVTKLHNGVPP